MQTKRLIHNAIIFVELKLFFFTEIVYETICECERKDPLNKIPMRFFFFGAREEKKKERK